MNKVFFTLAYLMCLLSAHGQSHDSRCEVKRVENIDQFEQWIHSKRANQGGRFADIVYRVPVVVHVLHLGEPIGEGYNFSVERIKSQIRTLNEDYRRKENTPGFKTNSDGDDARIEFILAQIDPSGNPTDGIVRVDMKSTHIPPSTGDIIDTCSEYSYWNPDEYLNIWCMATGLPPGLLLGQARFPVSDLPGLNEDLPPVDGVFINATNFGDGETNRDPNYNLGRTLTHEIGHFLGLFHIYGPCGQYTDYCEDTPPVNSATSGCPSPRPLTCDGRPAMIENYMDLSYDDCMNLFTKDQVIRMRTVLENSPRRKSLLTSHALIDVVDGVADNSAHAIKVYPNPTTDKLYIAFSNDLQGLEVRLAAYTLLGKMIFKSTVTPFRSTIELPVPDSNEKIFILTIETSQSTSRQLIAVH